MCAYTYIYIYIYICLSSWPIHVSSLCSSLNNWLTD